MITLPRMAGGLAALSVLACVVAGRPVRAAAALEPVLDLPSQRILRGVGDPVLTELLAEILATNPDVEEARERARAAEQVAPQVGALPDPMAQLTAFLLEPETRVGPQELSFALSQAFPWFGTLSVREQAALARAAAAWSRVEALRLQVVTEARRWYHELAYLRAEERVLREERRTLHHFEDLARARYESGKGQQQGPIKIQAEITRIDLGLLHVLERREQALAALNSLRARPGDTPAGVSSLPDELVAEADLEPLRATARARRPEVAAADAEIVAAQSGIDLARKGGKPSFTLGAGYTLVGRRGDAPGRAMPPADDGEDVLALTAGASLPVWRGKVRAGVEQAAQLRQAAGSGKRALLARIERQVADLASRLRVSRERVLLHDGLLVIQAEQALSSGLAAYSAGSASALDLLDAERILFAVRLSAERARADHAIAVARLEGAVGAPLNELVAQPAEEDGP